MSEDNWLFCHCAHEKHVDDKQNRDFLNVLKDSGQKVKCIPDLCRLSVESKGEMIKLAKTENLRIAACAPRAVQGLFQQSGTTLAAEAKVFNLREMQPNDLKNALSPVPEDIKADSSNTSAKVENLEVAESEKTPLKKDWLPWFPVIDTKRCTDCMQCLSFCLFDVYGVDEEGRIKVQNPDKCKTHCPACSRVCPEAAIMFPKFKDGIIGGGEVTEKALAKEKVKVDISSMLGGDLYSTLRNRSKRKKERFNPIADPDRDEDQALKERQACLGNLQKALGIPDSAMNHLPSSEEIQKKLQDKNHPLNQGMV